MIKPLTVVCDTCGHEEVEGEGPDEYRGSVVTFTIEGTGHLHLCGVCLDCERKVLDASRFPFVAVVTSPFRPEEKVATSAPDIVERLQRPQCTCSGPHASMPQQGGHFTDCPAYRPKVVPAFGEPILSTDAEIRAALQNGGHITRKCGFDGHPCSTTVCPLNICQRYEASLRAGVHYGTGEIPKNGHTDAEMRDLCNQIHRDLTRRS